MLPSNLEIITTDRLLLREYTPEASVNLFTTCSDNEIVRFLGLKSAVELEKEKWRFNNSLTTFNRSFHYFHLIHKKDNNVIGWCGFHTYYTSHDRAELGYEIKDDKDKGKGYMKEALPAVLKFGFENLNLHRVEAFIAEYNKPSYRLLMTNKFQQEGLMREHYFVNGKYEDSLVFSLLKKEFSEENK